ncbi:HdeD family acid-resistance protein [Clostridium aminobutyricum]|uniref:DUF308 domain-containing protein n=1 Tax=Clostridium aminobutyricum TaxID=33953 RepID=A0A939D6X2_CLOAM|nr:DUF308 domain-containing protein [Clostridium aminobutyricum]MBN7771953.1 DUF308 domain-containing protein [Clostridium aminobutyricum]
MRIITIISGILFVLSGLWCIINQGVTFAALAFIVGLVMVIAGLMAGLSVFSIREKDSNLRWALVEAGITVILGAVVLSNQLVTDLIVVMFFGMWVLFSGCNRLVASWDLKKVEHKGWRWVFMLAVISLFAGIYSFFNATLEGLPMGMLVGLFFLIQGVNTLTLGIIMPRSKKTNRRVS